MPARSIKVWNSTTSEWEDVAVASPDTSSFVLNSLVNAKGDLVTATANDTPAILTAGSNGQTLVADSSQTNGLRYIDAQTARNAITNSNFSVWQRGTSFSSGAAQYTADRWAFIRGSAAAGATLSRQTTSDTTNLPGIEFCARVQRNSGNTSTADIELVQSLETRDSRYFAGKSITLSFWARAGANYSHASSRIESYVISGTGTDQNRATGFFTGEAYPISATTTTLTTTWQRFTASGTVAATATQLALLFRFTPVGTAGANDWFEITGVQLEASPVLTPFEFEPYEATLRKCQRYYYLHASGTDKAIGMGSAYNTGTIFTFMQCPTTMRTTPSLVATSGTDYYTFKRSEGTDTFNSLTIEVASENTVACYNNAQIASTTGHAGYVLTSNAAASVAFNAEL